MSLKMKKIFLIRKKKMSLYNNEEKEIIETISVQDLCTKELKTIGNLYNSFDTLDRDPETFWNMYSKLIEAVICCGNTNNALLMLESYITHDRNAPDMQSAIKCCLKYCPEDKAHKMFLELMKVAHWHENYDNEFFLTMKELREIDKNNVLYYIVEEMKNYDGAKNYEFRVNGYFSGVFEEDSDIPEFVFGLTGDMEEHIKPDNKYRKELLEYTDDKKEQEKLLKIYDTYVRNYQKSILEKSL